MPDNPHLSETSSEILQYLSNVCYQLSKMLLNFFTLSSHKIMTSQQVSWFSDIICYFLFFSKRPCTSLRSSFVIKILQLFSSFTHAASVLIPDTWISLFLSKISKFRTTSNLKITSKNIPRKQKKITEYSKPMNENIICYQGLSFQIWVDYKKIWTKEK